MSNIFYQRRLCDRCFWLGDGEDTREVTVIVAEMEESFENKGWKHSEPLQGQQEVVISDQIQKTKQTLSKEKEKRENNKIICEKMT